jgi:hypothetical protein
LSEGRALDFVIPTERAVREWRDPQKLRAKDRALRLSPEK